MIPSTNGNSAPKGCNPISSNCVIWQGPNLPCIDLCTGDSISSVLAKLCEELVNITTVNGTEIDLNDLSPGCLQEAYPDAPFETIEDYISALIAYVCALDPSSGTTISAAIPVVQVPDCFIVSGTSVIKVINANTIVTSITNTTEAQQFGVTQAFVPPSTSATTAYLDFLDGSGPDPGFTLNTNLEPIETMILNGTNSTLYVCESQQSGGSIVWPFNGSYASWGELIGKMVCELSHCAMQCLSQNPIDPPSNTNRPASNVPSREPLSRANKDVIERMIKSQVQKSTRSVPKVISKYVLTTKIGKSVEMNVLLQALEKEFGVLRNMSGNVSEMRNAIMQEPMNLGNENTLNGNTKMGLLPGWFKTPKNLSESMANAWITIADIRSAVVDLQKNIVGNTTCQDIVYDVKGVLGVTEMGVVHGILLDFSGTQVNSPFADCGGQSKITVEDTDFNTITKYVSVISEASKVGSTVVSFNNTNINTASNYKVTVDMCFTDGDSQCAKSIQFNIENNQSCPTLTFPSTTATSIGFQANGVNGSAYDLTIVCESQAGNEYGRRVFSAPGTTVNGTFNGLPSGQTFNIYAELKSKGSGVTTKCPTVSTSTSVPACETSNVLSGSFGSSRDELIGNPLRIACYNDTVSTYSTLVGFDSEGNFKVVKCTDDVAASCNPGDSIYSQGKFISKSSDQALIIKNNRYPSTVGADKIDSGWKFINIISTPTNNLMYIYALINKDNNTVDQIVGSCDCAINLINRKQMNYCADNSSVSCLVDIIGVNNAVESNQVSITSQPYKGNVSYDPSLSTKDTLYFTYVSASSNWVNDSFKFTVANSCGTTEEFTVPVTRARKQSAVNDDIYVYVNTTSMDYTDAVDLKASLEAMKVKMQSTCTNWTGTIYYIPVDSTTDAGDYLNYPKSLIDMKAASSGSITVAGGSWTTWKSTPSYWGAGSKESPPTSATIIAFTNTTSTNTNYGHASLGNGWIGQPTASYQTHYEELQDLLNGTEVTTWGAANDTALKYFGTDGVRFKQILVPIMDSKTGESAAAALQMFGAIFGQKLKLAETGGIKVGDVQYTVDLTNYLLETSALAQAPYNMVTSKGVTMTGLKDSNFTIASWMDKGTDLSTSNLTLQNDLMATMGLDINRSGTNCSNTTQCSYKMADGGVVLWGYHASVAATACSQATNVAHCMEVYHPTSSAAFAGISYKSAAGACAGDASDEIETGFYARFNGSGTTYDRYVKTVGWTGSPGTC